METGWRSVAELFWRPLRTSVLIRQVWKNHFSAIADPSDRHEEGEQRWHYGSRGCEGRFRWDERLDSLSLCPNVQSILERVTDFCAGHPANDDCTVVRVTFTGLAGDDVCSGARLSKPVCWNGENRSTNLPGLPISSSDLPSASPCHC